MPIGALGIASLISGIASSASKMGGGIAASQKLKRAQSPESVYAQRYNQSFQNALNADLNNRLAATGMARTPEAQIAASQNLVNSLNTVAASEAASRDASRYSDTVQQSVMNEANRAKGIGGAVGGGLSALSSGFGALQQGVDRDKMLEQGQDRWNANRADNLAAQARAAQRFTDWKALQQQAQDNRDYSAALTAVDQVLPQATMPAEMYAQTPDGALANANQGYGASLQAADSMLGSGPQIPTAMQPGLTRVANEYDQQQQKQQAVNLAQGKREADLINASLYSNTAPGTKIGP